MSIRVTIYQGPTRRQGTGKTSGKPYDFVTQVGYAHTIDRDGNAPPVPEKFEFMLDTLGDAYAPGEYTLHPSAFYVRDNRLMLSAGRLTPVKPKSNTSAA